MKFLKYAKRVCVFKACAKVENLLENNNLTIHCKKQKRKKFYVRNVEEKNDRKYHFKSSTNETTEQNRQAMDQDLENIFAICISDIGITSRNL